MAGSVLVGVCALLFVAAVGAVLTVSGARLPLPPRVVTARQTARSAIDANLRLLGKPVTALVTLAAGMSVIVAVCWCLGKVAHALEGSVDRPIFHWFQARQVSSWSDLWLVLTNVGSPTITQEVTVAAVLFYSVVWGRRHRWAPAVTLIAGYVCEKYGQIILKLVVDRGHPPTTLGTFPSGGCARILVVYGLTVFLFLRWRQINGRRAAWFGVSLTVFILTVQAYARTYNLEHWFTDVVGGIIYGMLLLGLCITFFTILDTRLSPEPEARDVQTSGGSSRTP